MSTCFEPFSACGPVVRRSSDSMAPAGAGAAGARPAPGVESLSSVSASDRLFPTLRSSVTQLPRTLDTIDDTWLTRALQERYPGVVVLSALAERMKTKNLQDVLLVRMKADEAIGNITGQLATAEKMLRANPKDEVALAGRAQALKNLQEIVRQAGGK